MTLTDSALQLIDRYSAVFSKRLPLKGRKEITQELHSSLYDELEAMYPDAHHRPRSGLGSARDMGGPGKLALSYNEHSYLISPDIFPLFRLVFSIVAAVFGITAIASVIYHGLTSGAVAALIEIPKFISGMAAGTLRRLETRPVTRNRGSAEGQHSGTDTSHLLFRTPSYRGSSPRTEYRCILSIRGPCTVHSSPSVRIFCLPAGLSRQMDSEYPIRFNPAV